MERLAFLAQASAWFSHCSLEIVWFDMSWKLFVAEDCRVIQFGSCCYWCWMQLGSCWLDGM